MQMVICRGLQFGHILLNIHEDSERYLSFLHWPLPHFETVPQCTLVEFQLKKKKKNLSLSKQLVCFFPPEAYS